MKKLLTAIIFSVTLFTAGAQNLVYHDIAKDNNGNLIPWYNPNLGCSYDHCLKLVTDFWKNVPTSGGHKYYMFDHSWGSTGPNNNKLGGDQFAMALSSWALYYAYTGDTAFINDMIYIADTYLGHSLSNSFDAWPSFPFPCNYTNTGSAIYDGDFIAGPGITQPDKAASFAAELVTLYKITKNTSYLQQAVHIANVLADKVRVGDSITSPFSFRVDAQTGALPSQPAEFLYTANVTGALRLFEELKRMNEGNTVQYDTAYQKIRRWVQKYPQHTNDWGSFFEDIPIPSNTETNAVTMAWYILEHPDWSNTWQQDARSIMDAAFVTFGSHEWDSVGTTAIYEQTADMKEGSSHTSRFASVELIYAQKTGDTTRRTQAFRQLSWATYLVDFDGKCKFSPKSGSVWYTDGYGDFVRHYLRAMAAEPAIAPDSSNHLLGTTSVITKINYRPQEIFYTTFDEASVETLRLTSKPLQVQLDGVVLTELSTLNAQGWTWTAYPLGGVLKVKHNAGHDIDILWNLSSGIEKTNENEWAVQVFPNPATDKVNIRYPCKYEQQVKIDLTDVSGKMINTYAIKGQATTNTETISLNGLQPGIYFVRLTGSEGSCLRKVVVE